MHPIWNDSTYERTVAKIISQLGSILSFKMVVKKYVHDHRSIDMINEIYCRFYIGTHVPTIHTI